MSPEERDPAHLWDMLDAARRIAEYTRGLRPHEYLADSMMRDAVERNFMLIGEAARRVSEGFKKAHGDIPWRKIIGLRNILAHEYDEVRHEQVWAIVTERIPELVERLASLLPPPPPEGPE